MPEQLTIWREDVDEQRRAVAGAQADLGKVNDELERRPVGKGDWGELHRQQRFLPHHLEAKQHKLAVFLLFVRLIERGYSKHEACEQVYARAQYSTEQKAAPGVASALESHVEPPQLPASDTEQTPESELEPKSLAGSPDRLSRWRSSAGSRST